MTLTSKKVQDALQGRQISTNLYIFIQILYNSTMQVLTFPLFLLTLSQMTQTLPRWQT